MSVPDVLAMTLSKPSGKFLRHKIRLAALPSRIQISFPKNQCSGTLGIKLWKVFAMNRVIGSAALIPKTCIRTVSTTAVQRCVKPNLTNIRKKQIQFQMDNDVPIFLKGGSSDYILYYATWGLSIGGILLSAQAMYNLAKK